VWATSIEVSLSVAIPDHDRTDTRAATHARCGERSLPHRQCAAQPPTHVPRYGFPDPCDPWSQGRGRCAARCPGRPASPLASRKTQYKCGKFRVGNNHPL